MRITIPISAETFDRLTDLADRDFRDPRQEAAWLLAEMVKQGGIVRSEPRDEGGLADALRQAIVEMDHVISLIETPDPVVPFSRVDQRDRIKYLVRNWKNALQAWKDERR